VKLLLLLLFAAQSIATAQSSGLFAFDNAVGRGKWTPEQQIRTLKELGYDGISYNYTNPKDLAVWITTCRKHGIKLQGLYLHTLPDQDPPYDPAFKEAIPMLKGTGCVIWMTLREAKDKTRNHDKESVAIVRDIAGQAATHGLQVSIYPHAGFYIATAADSARMAGLADRSNVGPSLNLCHEFLTHNGDKLDETIRRVAPQAILVSLNGMDVAKKQYLGRLDQGDFDLAAFVEKVRAAGYKGPFGLQGYKVPGEPAENLRLSMEAWKKINQP
jgi:sugar phosphate isomerase/epimerase